MTNKGIAARRAIAEQKATIVRLYAEIDQLRADKEAISKTATVYLHQIKDEVIERVARRITAQKMRLSNHGESLPAELWEQALPSARAAIAAMYDDPARRD